MEKSLGEEQDAAVDRCDRGEHAEEPGPRQERVEGPEGPADVKPAETEAEMRGGALDWQIRACACGAGNQARPGCLLGRMQPDGASRSSGEHENVMCTKR